MPKGILIISGTWLLLNFLSYSVAGIFGAIISTYCCMAIVWFGRKKLSKLLRM